MLEQTLLALGAVHATGLVHRDVKPANLLLEPTDDDRVHVRLGDFGVAVTLAGERLTTSPAAVGTEGYMAPEQAAGQPPDPRQDLYAVRHARGAPAHRGASGARGAPCPPPRSVPCWSGCSPTTRGTVPTTPRPRWCCCDGSRVPPASGPGATAASALARSTATGRPRRPVGGSAGLLPFLVLGVSLGVTVGCVLLIGRMLGL